MNKKQKIIVFLVVVGILGIAIIYPKLIGALTKTFVQTDWSGGADTVSTTDDTNLLNWTKYYSETDGIDTSTSTELKLEVTVTQP